MTGLETAIRNAIARAGTPNAEARGRIYQSARMAVEKSLAKEAADDAMRAEQRTRLNSIIATIENEYRDSSPAPIARSAEGDEAAFGERASREMPGVAVPRSAEPSAPVVAPDPGAASRREDRPFVPPVAPLDVSPPDRNRHDPQLEVRLDDRLSAQRPVDVAPRAAGTRNWFGRRKDRRSETAAPVEKPRRRSGVGFFLVQLLILAGLLGGALWWISAQGGLEEAGRRLADRGAALMGPGPGGTGAPGQRVGAGQFEEDWAVLFEPSGTALPEVGGAASASFEDDEAVPFLSIVSVAAGAEGEVRVPLDMQTLGAFGGSRVLVALTMRADGEPTQIYIRCALTTADDCRRQRFTVNQTTNDLLFDIDLPANIANSDGHLIINSDVAGEGRGIDLFSVRLQPAS